MPHRRAGGSPRRQRRLGAKTLSMSSATHRSSCAPAACALAHPLGPRRLYVAIVIVVTPPLGASVMFAAVVVGQTLTALLIDHFGWCGVTVQPLSPVRLAGAALLVAGVVLIRLR